MSNIPNLLSCWHKLEHFNPSALPKEKHISKIETSLLEPWSGQFVDFKKGETDVYTLYLGVNEINIVDDFVEKLFEEPSSDQNKREGFFYFASLKLDAEGKYIKNTLGVSTMPWALGQLEQNKSSSDLWKVSFESVLEVIIEDADKILYESIYEDDEQDKIGDPKVMNYDELFDLEQLVIELSGWSESVESAIYLKRDKKILSKKEKKEHKINAQSDILNSFYTKDLNRVLAQEDWNGNSSALKKYLEGNLNFDIDRCDLSDEVSALEKNLRPLEYPDACWPSSYSLNLMQQFAVNTIVAQSRDEKEKDNLFSVNGPPGTGKTTLLRHAIAGIISERAKKMVEFIHPEEAFEEGGDVETDSPNFSHSIIYPKSEIDKGGVVIASSNNGAVQNISQELPQKEAVEPFEETLSYFRKVAENISEDKNWGVFSAVLGNKKNRNNFINDHWIKWKDKQPIKVGLQEYFKENTHKSNKAWKDVSKRFKLKLEDIEKEKQRLENIRLHSIKEQENLSVNRTHQSSLDSFNIDARKIESEINITDNEIQNTELRCSSELERLKLIQSTKPSFLEYWLSKKKRNDYKERLSIALLDEQNSRKELKNYRAELKEKISARNILLSQIRNLTELVQNIENELLIVVEGRKELGINFADAQFWENIDTKAVQNASPWLSKELQKLQIELFHLSLEVNETFLLTANAHKNMISKSLACFFQYLGGTLKVSKYQAHYLWSMFFLVVPTISSTFASVGRMFEDIDAQNLPWLFIDEAGQAIPQSAVGAIWRSQNVVVVGDPFQIEPVNTVPETIIKNLRESYELSPSQVHSSSSVQIGADRANSKGMNIYDNNGNKVWIGAPLKVHRRCIEPMFSIANTIAYDNLMYLSTPKPEILPLKMKSSFIHVEGIVSNMHFAPQQAEVISAMISAEIQHLGGLPDIYVISPFKEVAIEIRKYLKDKIEFQYDGKTKEESKFEFSKWINARVGTVHTFQGKQADGVFFCLGLDERTAGGATWASQKPNLLNVALTRAKYKFVAIGDESIWMKHKYFKELSKLSIN